MGSFTNAAENTTLDAWFGSNTLGPSGSWYLALFIAVPGESGSATEVSAPSYTRLAIPNNPTNWPAAVSGAKANAVELAFPDAEEAWGDVVGAALFMVSSGGTPVVYDSFAAKTVGVGDRYIVRVGDISITLD